VTQPDDSTDSGPTLASGVRAVARGADLDATLDLLLGLALADRGAAAGLVAVAGDDGLVRALHVAGAATLSSSGAEGEPLVGAEGEPLVGGATADPLAAAVLERRPVTAARSPRATAWSGSWPSPSSSAMPGSSASSVSSPSAGVRGSPDETAPPASWRPWSTSSR
jgi:hypothetical protein